ncbi:sulfotransferase family protein [Lignipirellula cremea]|uniref:Sulfotransferase domain protein n=1 Tax=Lignipirellula cremea TaxID=2528010 RepID=A0A518E354_9BACT|nr:sulfotransferase [Lignipirellula cremea]QDU98525.1 Sulfotransferase domain protein [Lignipirellula cremea]
MSTMTPASSAVSKPKKQKTNAYPFYSPRFWHGMELGPWLKLCVRHHFRVHLFRWPMAALITPTAMMNSSMSFLQRAMYGKQIAETPLEEPPVFIVGHWRSGTTHLHELLCCDERFAWPSTYECFAPHHFLVSESWLPKMLWWLLPSKRPMDNMAAGFERPQEDEFALVALGAPTPYTRMAFPNEPPEYTELLDMVDVPEPVMQSFQQAVRQFLQALTLRKKKRLMLKSPPHTGRVGVLAEMFPGARFVHISRDPMSLFPSTMRLWQSLDAAQSLQAPSHADLEEMVFSWLEKMYAGFEAQRKTIDPAHLYDLRYEDLVRDPIGEVRAIYERLELGDFEAMRPQLEAYLATQKSYSPNKHELEPELREKIRARWGGYMERYGYTDE